MRPLPLPCASARLGTLLATLLAGLLLSAPQAARATPPGPPIAHPLLQRDAPSDESLFPRSLTSRSSARFRAEGLHRSARSTARNLAKVRTGYYRAIEDAHHSLHLALRRASAYERPTTSFASQRGSLQAPVADLRARHAFGTRRRTTSSTSLPHLGLAWEVPPGTPVRAAARGVVVTATFVEGLGGLLILDHGEGWHTVYAQLISHDVMEGQVVLAGAPMGAGGNRSTFGPAEVYFEIRQEGIAVDPAPWLPDHARPRPGI